MIDMAQAESTLRTNNKPVRNYGVFDHNGLLLRVFTNQSAAIRFCLSLNDDESFVKPV